MKTIDKKQIQIIHVAKARIGMDEDDYRLMLKGRYGKESSKDLTYGQAHDLIEFFKTLGFKLEPKKRERKAKRPAPGKLPGNVVVLASHGQVNLIDILKERVAWRFTDGYERWLSKFLKVPSVRTASEANKVIEGLKGLIENQYMNKGGIFNNRKARRF